MKKVVITLMVCIAVLGIVFLPKYLNEGNRNVKFKVLENDEVPKKLVDVLPNYLAVERALGCKVDGEVFVVVTRGEKKTEGYSVTIDKIEKVKGENGEFDIIVHALFKDPKPDEMVEQRIIYPFVIVKTGLDELPKNIELETEYIEWKKAYKYMPFKFPKITGRNFEIYVEVLYDK